MSSARPALLIFAGAILACLVMLRPGVTQSTGLRRITNTNEEGLNLNPSISGDGRVVAFESTEDVAAAGGTDHFRAITVNIEIDPGTFFQVAGSRAVTPAISQDGSRIAFASKDDPLRTNPDGNSEIFLFDSAKLIQITKTSAASLADRVTQGNFQPSISDDGRFIAFSSNRDLDNQNSDGNLEIFIYDVSANAFAQVTNSSGIVGFTDAKISGDGSAIAFIRDNGPTPSTTRDLMRQPRVGPTSATIIAANVQSLAMTYGRAISDDGLRVVYAAQTATNTTQVFLFDGRNGGLNRQITSLGARVTEVPLHPTISGDGSRIAFAARRSVSGAPTNSDGGVELYLYDLPTATFSKLTNASSSATADIVSSLSDDGAIVAFNFPRILSGAVANSGTENNSEIYAIAPPVRPANGTLTSILNQASFEHEPAAFKAVAPDSLAIAQGTNLASTTLQSQKLPNGEFPTNVAGTRVTVNGRAAQIVFVSPAQVIFIVPPQTEIGAAEVVVTNGENFPSRGTLPTLRAAPGIFTKTGDGIGEGQILNSDTLQEGPFNPTGGNLELTVFATGARHAAQTTVAIGGTLINADAVVPSADMQGLDEIHVRVPSDMRGAGVVNLSVISDGRESNPVTVNFIGDPGRAIFFNEVLADPPDGVAGDANHDGVRDGTQDEFVELVNGSLGEPISLSGWTIKTRANGSTTETTRFSFPAGTSLPAGEALVVFGGGGPAFNPNDEVFGCAQIFKATSSSGLALTNTGLTLLLRNSSGNLIAQFSYGGATALDGNASQALTRSPDFTGSFVLHATALNASGRKFSPGLRTDGTPFGNCPGSLTSVIISPTNASIVVGQTTQFSARTLDQYGRTLNGIPIGFESDNINVATIDSTSASAGVTTAMVRTKNPGTSHITASAIDGPIKSNSSPATLTVTGPSLSINDVSLTEGNAGTTIFTFTVSLSSPAPAPVTFDIATQDNTATVADNDYVGRSVMSQTIPTGQQTYSFDVSVNGDQNIEPDESFLINVTNVGGASVTRAQGVGRILSDDVPALSVNDVSAFEGDSGTTTFTFTVSSTLPAPSPGITFDIATANGTTAEGSDYIGRSLTSQTLPTGQTDYTFAVTVNGDKLVEPHENFFVNLSHASANAIIADSQGVGTIQNDDNPSLVISQIYPGGGLSNAAFTNDYVEVFNRGDTTIDFSLTPYSVQFLSVTASSWTRTDLTAGIIPPGHYFLVREASGGTNGSSLPASDATGTINLTSTTGGKVALVSGTTTLSGSCPGDDGAAPFNASNSTIADFVGYGGTSATTNQCYEGSGPSSFNLSNNTIAGFRKAGGCTDTNDNATDFLTAGPLPRNSISPANNCMGAATPNLSINDVSVTEGDSGTTTATFTVTLSSPAQGVDVAFDIATQNGDAIANGDYVNKSLMNQVIPAGATAYSFTVTVNGDTTVEADENFFVNVTNVAGATVSDGQGQGTIRNDDLPSLSINDVTAKEGNSGSIIFSFTVSLSAPAPAPVLFDIATQDETATVANNDYVARSLSGQTIGAGQTTYTFDVVVNGDAFNEPNETFFVNIANVSGATMADGQAVGTIENDDSPALSIDDVTMSEGDAGATAFTFTVTLSPQSADTVNVEYATANGTALTPIDYGAISPAQLSFAPGETTKQITVQVNADTLVEPNETFFVNLSAPANATISKAAGTGTITNDDIPNLVISQLFGGGNNSGAPFQNDFVEIFNRGVTTVDFSITPYSIQYASVGSNFGATTASAKTNLTTGLIAPGRYFLIQESGGASNGVGLPAPDVTGSIALAATSGKVALVMGTNALAAAACPGDDLSSPFNASDSTIADFVGYGSSASNAGQCYEGLAPAVASSNTTADFRRAGGCTDTNDNAANFFATAPTPRNSTSPANACAGGGPPDLSINDVSIIEGNSGTTTATFTVNLSAPAQGADVMFDIATANGTATTANSDYVTRGLTNQIIPAGQTAYSFTVTINGDTMLEPDETFFVNLTNISGAHVADGQGQGIIQNDDLPALSIDDVSSGEGDNGKRTFSFQVTLSAPAPGPVTFDIATAAGSARDADGDYVSRALTNQTIAQGATSYIFDVTINGDQIIEPNEDFFVNVSNVSGATVLDSQGQGIIQNDDTPLLSVNNVMMPEGDTGTTLFTFIVTSTLPAPAGGITFDIATSDGTAQDHNPATEDDDYVARSLTNQTIPAGQTTYSFAVMVNGDKFVESDETFHVTVSHVSAGAGIGDGTGDGTIQNDDVARLVISQIYGGGNNSGATFQNDFVELFNRGTTTVNFGVTPYSIQYASQTGNFSGGTGNKLDLTTGSLVPGQYFLVQLSGGTTNGSGLPPADATGSINMAASDGKVVLVNGTTTAVTVSGCPTGITLADFVGYGGANCSETSPTGSLSATKSALRKNDGCTDTENNLNDFLTLSLNSGTPPRNSSSPINDCNAPPTLSIDDVSATEGNSGTKLFTFTVSLSKPALVGAVSFDIATQDDTAIAGIDYVGHSLTNQTIPADQQTYTFTVIVNGDADVERDETFLVNVTNVTGAIVADSQGLGTIQNDDTPALSISDVTLNEGNSGTSNFDFIVTLSPASDETVTVNYATTDGTANAPGDYTAIPSTQLTFNPGETVKTISISVNGDTVIEPNETFTVKLIGATNANILDAQGVGTITNDDGANVVISQVYGGGSNAGATFNADYVELFNRTSTAINITSWSIQYQAATTTTGAAWSVSALCPSGPCVIPANSYYLVRLTTPGATGAALPTPDSMPTNPINMAATAGKVALVSNTIALSGTAGSGCPALFANVIDLVGYGTGGSGANCFEGAGAAPTISATLADFRKSTGAGGANGCFDSNNNNADFSSAAPSPRNSALTNTCP